MLKRGIDKILKNPSGNLFVQLIRYFVSGGVAFVVDASLLYILTEWLGFHYLLSTVLSYSFGLVITYMFSMLLASLSISEAEVWMIS